MAKDTEKLIRQLSLISFLMAERRPISALEIRQDVEGYAQMTSDEAFNRRFYADRAELSSLGIELKIEKQSEGSYEAETYTLPRRTSTCPLSSSTTPNWPRCAPRSPCSTASSPTPSRCGWPSSSSRGASPPPCPRPSSSRCAWP